MPIAGQRREAAILIVLGHLGYLFIGATAIPAALSRSSPGLEEGAVSGAFFVITSV
ncbi:hypothetical protein [Bosea sp. ANAM02]|uniref:hypothetical protein n=1 Tax=Bosea sp. ANAM02 TaxID=2020412 RepID=UPI00156354E9|nr:hypothetical protein [Bosea sp. ANAM02]